jgi:alpha-tubulin suppressor-like RCC1 family protein
MAQSTVGRIRFNPRNDWVSGTSYLVDDIVTYKNKFYICKVNNSSTTLPALDTTNWQNYGGGTNHVGEYAGGTTYQIGDIVTHTTTPAYNSHYNYVNVDTYICIQAGAGFLPSTQPTYWTKISEGTMRDKHAWLSGINEGYVPGYKATWDAFALSTTVGMGDSFGEFKTPGSHLTGSPSIQYITKRYTLVGFGGNVSGYLGSSVSGNDAVITPAEAQFTHLSWFDGSLPTSPTTQAPRIIQVEGDMYSSALVLFDNGEVHHSGYNGHGQNGQGNTTNYPSFVQCGYANVNRANTTTVLRSKKVIRIASSADGRTQTHSCYALVRNSNDTRELYAWGYNGYGQLGQGNTTDRQEPTLVSFDQVTNGKIIEIWSTGREYAQFWLLTDQGKMYAMGYNGNGNLGVGNTTNQSSLTLVKNWGTGTTNRIKKFNTSGGNNVGHDTSFLVIRGDNTLHTWGRNIYGQLAHNHAFNVCTPIEVYTGGYTGATNPVTTTANAGTPSGTKLTDVVNAWHYGGQHGSMIVTRGTSDTSNTAYTVGYNGYYQLSVAQNNTTNYSTLQATQIRAGAALTNVIDVASNCGESSYTNLAVKRSDGEWYFCGSKENGGWASGDTDSRNIRQNRDPDNLASNYRLKNNIMYPHIQSQAYRSYWKYLPFGATTMKSGMYIDLSTGKVYYTTSATSEVSFNNSTSYGTYHTTMTRIKGQG